MLWKVSPFSNIIFRLLRGTVGFSMGTSLCVHFSIAWSLSLNNWVSVPSTSWPSVDSSEVLTPGSKGCRWWLSCCVECVLGSGDVGVSAGCSQSCFRTLRLLLREEGVDFSGDCKEEQRDCQSFTPGVSQLLNSNLDRRQPRQWSVTVLLYYYLNWNSNIKYKLK